MLRMKEIEGRAVDDDQRTSFLGRGGTIGFAFGATDDEPPHSVPGLPGNGSDC